MPYLTCPRAVLGAAFILLLQLAPAEAQELTFVATSGSDANNCLTPATACRFLQRAHDAARSGNKIVVLDSGDFRGVTITKSIAIAATGVHAHLFVGSSTKIAINAGPDDVIDIDGLAMGRDALVSSDSSGILFNSGGRLHVRNCTIRNQGTAGIYILGSNPSRVFISDCTIADNLHGIWAQTGSKNVSVFLDRVTVEGNLRGVRSQGSGARVRISNSTITNNRRGLLSRNGGQLISFGNNAINGNNNDGAPTATVALK